MYRYAGAVGFASQRRRGVGIGKCRTSRGPDGGPDAIGKGSRREKGDRYDRDVGGSIFSFAMVAVGGGLGCAARIAVRDSLAAREIDAAWTVLGVNLVGSALAGAVAGLHPEPDSTVRLVAIGVLSGWTTYSAFSIDVLNAVRGGRPVRAAILWTGTLLGTPLLALLAARLAGGAAA